MEICSIFFAYSINNFDSIRFGWCCYMATVMLFTGNAQTKCSLCSMFHNDSGLEFRTISTWKYDYHNNESNTHAHAHTQFIFTVGKTNNCNNRYKNEKKNTNGNEVALELNISVSFYFNAIKWLEVAISPYEWFICSISFFWQPEPKFLQSFDHGVRQVSDEFLLLSRSLFFHIHAPKLGLQNGMIFWGQQNMSKAIKRKSIKS